MTEHHRDGGSDGGSNPSTPTVGSGPAETIEAEYAAARTVLLDALEALHAHRESLTLVGAQAVYLRTGHAGLTVAPFTTDGDLALDPGLGPEPALETAMTDAGFTLLQRADSNGYQPGRWARGTTIAGRSYTVPIDLMVPDGALPAANTRGARLGVHGKRAAMRTPGLEACLIDREPQPITGLAPGDTRSVTLNVAGPAALLVAKLIKLTERIAEDRTHRLKDKDAGDVLRLIRATPVTQMASRLTQLRHSTLAAPVTATALAALPTLFGRPGSPGIRMAIRAVALDLTPDQVTTQLTAYVTALTSQL